MSSYSVHVPFLPTRPDQIRLIGEVVQRASDCRLWLGQSMTIEPHQFFAYGAGLGLTISAGTSVTLMPLRHPYEAALQARSLAQLTARPFVAGYGPGGAGFQQALLGRPYPSPLAAAREYLTMVRGILDGEPVELGLGVLRPGMARLAGEIADVAITWLCPPAYLRDVLIPELRAGASRMNRPMPRVVSVVHVAQRKPGRDPAKLAYSVCHQHLQAPHYADMLGRAGVPVDVTDPESGARLLVDSGVFLHGTMRELVHGLAAYQEAGVDEIVLNLSAVGYTRGEQTAVRELEFLLAELGSISHCR